MRRAKTERGLVVPKPPPMKTWLSRDSFEGTLEPFVDIWATRPERFAHDGDDVESLGVTWFDGGGGIESRVGRLSVANARQAFGTVPDDDRQLIVIG